MAINTLMRKHWAVRRNEKKLWMEEMRVALKAKNMKILRAWADLGAKVKIFICVHHPRSFDADNLYSCGKLPLDAAKGLGIIADDDNKHLELSITQEHGSPKFTFFSITKL